MRFSEMDRASESGATPVGDHVCRSILGSLAGCCQMFLDNLKQLAALEGLDYVFIGA